MSDQFGLAVHKDKKKYILKSAMQLLIHCYGKIRVAQVPERVSTMRFVVKKRKEKKKPKSNHLGAQGTCKGALSA